jgi:hypothetical protein
MNGINIYRKWLKRSLTLVVLAAGATRSCLALLEDRQHAWEQDVRQAPGAFYAVSHSLFVDNFFAGLR